MTIRRVALAVAVPGWDAFDRRRAVAVGLALPGVVAPFGLAAYVAGARRSWLALSLDADFLTVVMVVAGLAAVARVAAIGELWVASGCRPVGGRDLGALAVAVAVVAPFVVGVVEAGRARAAIGQAFVVSPGPLFETSAEVAPLGAGGDPTGSTIVPADRAIVPIAASAERSDAARTQTTADVTTVLLIGGDAGPGRWSLRTDTMMLFSLHRPSGRAALVSIPRNLRELRSPPGSALGERFPDGFDDLANAVYPFVTADDELAAAYSHGGVEPGVMALAEAIGYSLDVTIDDYVLVDMQGFLDLVDAVGGVTVAVPRAVPMPGNVPGAHHDYPDVIGPGTVHMDGTTALGYVRSRSADSDYQRTARQRDLLAALATQISLGDVVASFDAVTSAVGDALRTSLTPDELADTLAVIGGGTAIVESVGLVPPLVDVARPDYRLLAEVVGDVQVALATGVPSGW